MLLHIDCSMVFNILGFNVHKTLQTSRTLWRILAAPKMAVFYNFTILILISIVSSLCGKDFGVVSNVAVTMEESLSLSRPTVSSTLFAKT